MTRQKIQKKEQSFAKSFSLESLDGFLFEIFPKKYIYFRKSRYLCASGYLTQYKSMKTFHQGFISTDYLSESFLSNYQPILVEVVKANMKKIIQLNKKLNLVKRNNFTVQKILLVAISLALSKKIILTLTSVNMSLLYKLKKKSQMK